MPDVRYGLTLEGTFEVKASIRYGLTLEGTFNILEPERMRVLYWDNNAISIAKPPVTFTDGDTTPSVAGGKVFKTSNTAATSITFFDDPIEGQEITIIFGDANTTLVAGTTVKLKDGLNYTGTLNGTIQLIYQGGTWYETGRSSN
jgi:hypothetical protein